MRAANHASWISERQAEREKARPASWIGSRDFHRLGCLGNGRAQQRRPHHDDASATNSSSEGLYLDACKL
jgi:hypothetical protein